MSEPRIVNIMEFLDRSSRVINLKIRLRMTVLQFGILHSTNKPDALQNRGSSKQTSQDIIIGNIQTMKASNCVVPPQLRSIHG